MTHAPTAIPATASTAGKPRAARSFHSPFDRDAALALPELIGEELFRDAIERERSRVERLEDAFILVLISLTRAARQSRWEHLVEALSHTHLDADVIGWFKRGSIVGLIRSLDRDSRETAATLADTLQRELTRAMADSVEGCSIRVEICSPHGEMPAPVAFDVEPPRGWRAAARDAAKRTLDIAGSLLAFVVFSPVFAVVAALVKATSSGPVFFRQQRVGYGGRLFTMFKFRTMQVHADSKIHQQYFERFMAATRATEPHDSAPFKIVDDPRITPIGRFLRKSSLDEFPQFWNVLKGEMSLVGPRPPLPYEVARYKRWHRRRVLDAKPGLTGLWQVHGRSRTTFDEMVRLDLQYARRRSVWMDLRILCATPAAVLSGRGAR